MHSWTSLRLDIEEAQFPDLLRFLHEEHRTDDPAVSLGDPAALARRLEVPDEGGADLGDERLEAFVPAVFLVVEQGLPVDDPAHVAGLVAAQHDLRLRLGLRVKKRLDRLHCADEPGLGWGLESAEQRADLLGGAAVDRLESLPAGGRERDQALTCVGFRRPAPDEPLALEPRKHAAEIAGIEPQLFAKLARRDALPLGDLIDDAPFRQRERAG